jgi:hypothetical protein
MQNYDEIKAQYDNQIQSLHEQYEIAYDYIDTWIGKAFRLSRDVDYCIHRPVDEDEYKALTQVIAHLSDIMTLLLNELSRIKPLRTNNIAD